MNAESGTEEERVRGERTVSVVIPVWKDFGNLERCLRALDSQTIRKSLEIVVSVDGLHRIPPDLESLADLVLQGGHAGPAAARNRGWRRSTGSIVLFTDDDCVPEPDWAEQMLGVLRSGAHAVKGVYSSGGGRLIQRLAQVEFQERYRLLCRGDEIDLVDTYSAGYLREALEAVDGFDESFPHPDHEDVDLSYRLVSRGFVLKFAPSARVAHLHRDSWKAYFRMKHGRGRWRTRVLRRFPGKTGSDSYTPACLRLQIVLCVLLPPVLAALAVSAVPLAVWTALFLLSTGPLVLTAARHDPVLIPLIPPFSLWRGCALSSGLLRGIFGPDKEER